jgi:hypothetical protein
VAGFPRSGTRLCSAFGLPDASLGAAFGLLDASLGAAFGLLDASLGAGLAEPVVFEAVPGLGLARLVARGFGARFGFGVTGTDAAGVAGAGGTGATGSLWPGTAAGRLSLRRWGRLRGRPPRTPGGGSSLITHIIAH